MLCSICLHACLHFALGEVAVAVVDGFELAAVDAMID
jgi:hypothetical protein